MNFLFYEIKLVRKIIKYGVEALTSISQARFQIIYRQASHKTK